MRCGERSIIKSDLELARAREEGSAERGHAEADVRSVAMETGTVDERGGAVVDAVTAMVRIRGSSCKRCGVSTVIDKIVRQTRPVRPSLRSGAYSTAAAGHMQTALDRTSGRRRCGLEQSSKGGERQ